MTSSSSSAASHSTDTEYNSIIPAYLLEKGESARRHYRAEELRQNGKHLEVDITNTYPSEQPPPLPIHCKPNFLNNSVGGSGTRQKIDTTGLVDTSLLPCPTHVVLNHLFACSIRDNVMSVVSHLLY
jgi:hypothetical protein